MARVKKAVKKRWFEITAPPEFNKAFLGETIAADPKEVVGRRVTRTLGSVIGDMKKQSINATFRVNEVKEKTAATEFVKYEMAPAHVKRLTKKARNKADDSFVCETRDKVQVRIKPLILTRNKVQKGVLSDLRMMARKFFKDEAKELSYSQLITAILQGNLHRGMRDALRKVYPSLLAEIRAVQKV